MEITKHHWAIIALTLCVFVLLDGYYLRVELTQNSKRNYFHLLKSFSRNNSPQSIQTTEVSPYLDLPKWLPGCEKIFLDLGANIGVTVRKLLQPERYPKSPTLFFFNKTFGNEWLYNSINKFPRRLCALGFEPNPKHQKRLKELERMYLDRRWNVHFFPLAISNGNGNITFYTKDNCPVSPYLTPSGGGVLFGITLHS